MKTRSILGGWSLLDGVPKSAKKRKLADGSRAMRERALIRGKGVLFKQFSKKIDHEVSLITSKIR
jgi:hypothetical protein